MTEAQTLSINDVPQDIADDVQRMIGKIGSVIDGERSDTVLTALVCIAGTLLTGPGFDDNQKKAGSLFLLSMASKITVDVGVSDTEIMSAMVQPGFYGDQQNAEAQPN